MILAVSLQAGFDSIGILKVLAVAGGAGVGGLLFGWLFGGLSRALTAQKLPPKLRLGSRVGGAGIGGWLVALWAFGGPGFGPGWGGGPGNGTGEGTGVDNPPAASKDADSETQEPSRPGAGDVGRESLRVEVLGGDTLKKIARGEKYDPDRCYRVESGEGSRLLTLSEVKELIRQRRKQTPPLRRLEIVLYNDSPAHAVPYVARLSQWARDQAGTDEEKIRVDFSEKGIDAPTQ